MNKDLKSIKFPGLEDTYVIPEGGSIDIDLNGANEGEANPTDSDTLGGLTLSSILNKIYPIGSVYVTQTNNSPASYLGGTWELFDKNFTEKSVSNVTDYAILSDNCSAVSLTLVWHDHTITAQITFTPTITITDSTLEMFTLNLSKLGVSSLKPFHNSGASDGGQSVIMFNISASGVFTTRDIIIRASDTASLETGYSLVVTTDLITNHKNMLDNFCDKFYWKRTS